MKSLRLATFVFCALFAGSLLAQDQMRPGQWEMTMKMEMAGLPAGMGEMKMPPQCITPEQAKDPGSTVQAGRGRGGGDCKTTDQKMDGNKFTWKMECTGAVAMTGDGEMVFNGDSYTGKVNMNMAGQGQMSMQMTGKRIGDCAK
jgi:hypothetical protein